ncbi:G-type lectin S-receptor-like serine/threonine-protein kinase At5g24080 [Rhodamnia argentea]|uniref:Receptor-like serine/threonine-protein kinase n=1 Tax=Rhodamnia argentea TaxID=178133 RepID=A0ABM3H9Y2_9MYRT|nr:G-type lectin S-receptor-like serine/threonine-protein kinase At5g24080 [Rhodamnia argentea]
MKNSYDPSITEFLNKFLDNKLGSFLIDDIDIEDRDDIDCDLDTSHNGSAFACAFFTQNSEVSYFFGVAIVQTDSYSTIDSSMPPAVVWSANRDRPVGAQATVELTGGGDLVLKDTGSIVWSTQTDDTGSLVLFDENNNAVWQSFDQPANTLLPGQNLRVGQKLTTSYSATNMSEYGLLSVSLTADGLFAQMETNPPQYLRLESDGHMRVYQQNQNEWIVAHDVLTDIVGDCGDPMVCGNYGICTGLGKCSCPDPYFKPRVDTDPGAGCSETIPLTCEASQSLSFLDYGVIAYFTGRADTPIFDGRHNISGSCYLVSQVFSITNLGDSVPHWIISIKVQNPLSETQIPHIPSEPPVSSPSINEPPVPPNGKRAKAVPTVIITSSLRSLLAFILLVVVIKCRFRNKGVDGVEEDYLDHIPGAPKRFTYDDLKAITEDFNKRLGEGGFSVVYQGTLANGTKVAVKHLNGLCQSKKSFLAEVESIGNIHHVNLVQLIGFCAENCHRLLVYEYMSKGSLDKWIFHGLDESFVLDWQQKRKIICDMAKGLCYLHEECRWKIVHMDIKPQNILLDENFNAKVADFGLSKLVDKDQSQIVTTMRGTPGYLAPEWLHTAITEKVDIYSFGVVILEIVCGRKVFDESQDQEDMYLLGVLKRKVEEGRILDMIDKNSEDMQLNGPHVVDMMRLAAWCLQVDFKKRPSMSTVIKVLERVIEVPDDLDYNSQMTWIITSHILSGQMLV